MKHTGNTRQKPEENNIPEIKKEEAVDSAPVLTARSEGNGTKASETRQPDDTVSNSNPTPESQPGTEESFHLEDRDNKMENTEGIP